jgi:hypothetical protein
MAIWHRIVVSKLLKLSITAFLLVPVVQTQYGTLTFDCGRVCRIEGGDWDKGKDQYTADTSEVP